MKHPLYKTIKGKFLIIVTTLILILSVGIIWFCYSFFYRSLQNSAIHSIESNLQFMADKINSQLSDIYAFTKFCQNNSDIVKFVTTGRESDNYASVTSKAKARLDEEYLINPANRNSSSPYIQRVVVANLNRRDYLQYVNSAYSIDKSMVDMIRELPYFNEALEKPAPALDYPMQKVPFIRKDVQMFPIVKPIENPYGKDTIGFVFIEVNPKLFVDASQKYTVQENTNLFFTVAGTTYRLNNQTIEPFNEDFTVTSMESDAVRSENKLSSVEYGNTSGLAVTVPLSTGGCYLSQLLTPDTFMSQMNEYISLFVLVGATVLFSGFLLYRLLSHIVNQPVHILNRRLDQIAKGDFSHDDTIEWENELGDIGRSINQLSAGIKELMEKRIEDAREKKDYEYRMLQSQINPHFLYNTLNSIKWMATIQNAPGIAEMVTSLSRLLKNIAKGTETIVTIENEFKLLDDYFVIQKYRYGGAITMDYQVDEPELIQNKIPRFSLQPIVENAIFHGIEPKGCEGHIRIHLYRSGADIRIDVADNGVGMTREAIERTLASDIPDRSNFFKDVGVSSVHKRILYTFGDGYGLSITSEPGKYTTMSLLLKNTLDNEKGEINHV